MSIPCEINPMGAGELPAGYIPVKALRCEVSDFNYGGDGRLLSCNKGSYIEWFSSFDASYRFDMTLRYYQTFLYQRNGCYTPNRSVQFGMNANRAQFLIATVPPSNSPRSLFTSDLNKHTVVIDLHRGVQQIDTTIIGTFTPEAHVWDFGFTLGACAQLTSGTSYDPVTYCAEEIYECRAYKNGTLCSKLIPCLDPTGRPCVYDSVRKLTLYNQGPNEFTVLK